MCEAGGDPCKNPDKEPLPLGVQAIFRRKSYSIQTHPVYDLRGSIQEEASMHTRRLQARYYAGLMVKLCMLDSWVRVTPHPATGHAL